MLANLKLPTGESAGYTLQGAAPVTARVDGQTATYPSILADTDLELHTYDSGIKETLVLKSAQAASSWTFPLTLNGLTPRMTDSGEVELLNAAGVAVAWFPHGSMEDSKFDLRSGGSAESGAVTYRLAEQDGGTVLKVTADRAWLDDPARVYPVRVDPTATTIDSGDVYVDNDSTTTNQNGNDLPIGTYDGTVKARSFMHFDSFAGDGFTSRHVSKAVLQLYLTWQPSCTVSRAFDVRAATSAWTVDSLKNNAGLSAGPSYSAPIGSLTVTDPGDACTNSAKDRSKGKWVNVTLDASVIDKWARQTSPNYGLALTASETDVNAWKKFTSANYSDTYKPRLSLTYTNNVAPQVDVRYPANNAVVQTLTPELLAKGHDSDNWPGKGQNFTFGVLGTDGSTIAVSSAVNSSWTVPAGKLNWNTTYLYTVKTFDGVTYSPFQETYAFTTSVPQPAVTSSLAQNGGKGFDASIGNYTTSATDASVTTVGPSLAITRTYNSLDTRRDTAFGVGWSSVLDAKATQIPDAAGTVQSVRVTYPTGEEVAFGRTATGTFVPPSGRFSTFAETKSGSTLTGYTLTDKNATIYTFGRGVGGGVFRLTAITDANGRTMSLGYDGDGNPTTMTSASGRHLSLSWSWPDGASAPRVETVSTDRADPDDPDSASVWTYTYRGEDQLGQVCQPDGENRCWQYWSSWISQYRNSVLNLSPAAYWPLDEAGGTMANSAVLANAGMDVAAYNNVTLGQGAHLDGSTATTAGFNGTSSFVQLPSNMIAGGQYQSVSMWFKTATPGGVLFSYSHDQVTAGTTSGDYVPALYIDKYGKLRGEFWNNTVANINSNTVVTDNNWHHVVLAGVGSSQTLYLDGNAAGTIAGTISVVSSRSLDTVTVGAGFVGGGWPDHANSGAAPAKATYFNGQISDVAFFNTAITAAQAGQLNWTGRNDQPVLDWVGRPSGNGANAWVDYDAVTGRVARVGDENGGAWTLDTPKIAGSSAVYAGQVLGAKPQDYWRFADAPGDGVSDAVNQVSGGIATYSNVTLGVSGPFPDASAAKFDGSSSYVELPPTDIPAGTGPSTVEMWFNMPAGNTAGGVLFGAQIAATDEPTGGGWTPVLYVDVNGKLRGSFWTTNVTNMVTSASVNDGKWHHVALTATNNNTQVLYLDGAQVGTSTATITNDYGAQHAYLGVGRWTSWPGNGSTDIGWFPGSIAEAAVYKSALSAAQVADHVATAKQTASVAMTMIGGVATAIAMPVQQVVVHTPDTGPDGDQDRTQVSSYDLVNGNRLVAQTDERGQTTKYGYDVGGYASMVYDPKGVLTQTLQDVRGNTIQSITCQDQSANKCSSVYFSYFPDATSKALTPNPKNDLLLTTRDARTTPPATAGAAPSDDRYLTTNTYDDHGNLTAVTDPLHRVTATTYTDHWTAAVDGGAPPDGLPETVTTPGGQTKQVVYFQSGDVAEIHEPNGKVTKFTYDGLGQVLTETETTADGGDELVTTHTYDKMSREVTQTDPSTTNRITGGVHTRVSTSTYDADGNVTAVTTSDATGGDDPRTEQHTYNDFGQEESSTTPGGAQTWFDYDAMGRIVKQTSPDGTVTTNSYDATGNLTDVWLKDFTGDPNDPQDPTDLRLEHNEYDEAGRLASETDAENNVTYHTYTDNGLEATITRVGADANGNTVTYQVQDTTYDEAGNPLVELSNNGLTKVSHVYDAAGRETSSTADPDTLKRTSSVTFDADDNPISNVQTDASGTVTAKMETLYDNAGRTLAELTYRSTTTAPVARWKMSDGSGSTAADTAGNSPLTLSSTGGANWSTEHGGALAFNNTGGTATTNGATVDTGRSFTVSAWVKLTAGGHYMQAVAGVGTKQTAFDLGYNSASNRWEFRLGAYDTVNPSTIGTQILSTSTPQTGTWTLLTGVYDAASKTGTLYVGDTAEASATAQPYAASVPTVLGTGLWNGDHSDYFNGAVSDVQLYQQALTGSNVTGIKNATFPAADAGVIRTSYTYDADDEVTSVTDPNGNTSYTAYDEDGHAVKTTAPAAMAESATSGAAVKANAVSWTGYNTFGEVTDTKDALGNWSATYYDADGRATLERQPAYTPPGPGTTEIVPETMSYYTASGQVDHTTDPNGNNTWFDYDQLDRLSKVTAVNGAVTKYTYDKVGNQLSMTSPTGAVTSTTYDYLGRQASITDAVRQDNASYTTTYNYKQSPADGWSTTVTSPRGVTSKTTYNQLGDAVSSEDGAHNVTTTTYDGGARPVKTTLADGTYTTTGYDLAGRALSTTFYDENDTFLQSQSSEYDAAGNVIASTDARHTRTTFTYDATGVLTAEHQPINSSAAIDTSFGYDLEGNQTRFTDGRGNAFWTTYNSWGLPESQIEPATTAYPNPADRTYTTSYDIAARATKLVQPGGVTTTNTYDDLGQLTKQAGTGAEATTTDRSFGYDLDGRLISFNGNTGTNTISYDDRNLPKSITGTSGNTSYTYDEDGDLASRADAAGTTAFHYDSAGRVDQLTNTSKNVTQLYTYTNLNTLSKITYGAGNNYRTFTYDKQHRLTGDDLKNTAGTTIAKIGYGWNDNGDLTSKTTTNLGGTTTTNTYDYDLADRLTSWNNGTATTAYAYDKSGNRLQNGSKLFTYDARNRLLTGDGASYAYTARGTLSSSGANQTKADAFGQVITQKYNNGGGTKTYSYDGLGRVMQTGFAYTGTDNDLAGDGTSTYVRGGGNEVVAEATSAGTKLAWTDLHDDIVAQFTATGTTLAGSRNYDPLGKVIATSGALVGSLGYQSEYTDNSTNRVNMMARWYNTDTGQFDTRDTANNSPVPDSVNANRYQYGDANPLTVTDPSGHWGVPSWAKKAVKVVTAPVRATVSVISSAASYGYSKASSAYSASTSYLGSKLKTGMNTVSQKYHQLKKAAIHKAKSLKKKVDAGVSKLKRNVKIGYSIVKKKASKTLASGIDKAKKIGKASLKVIKQSAGPILSGAKRVGSVSSAVLKDGWNKTKKFVVEHKDVIYEIGAIGLTIAAGAACGVVTAGVAALACMAGAGALINMGKDALQGDINSWGDALGSAGTGAVNGLLSGTGGGGGFAKAATMIGGKAATGLTGRVATEMVENGAIDGISQLANTGKIDPRSMALGMVPGLGKVERKTHINTGTALKDARKSGLISGVETAAGGVVGCQTGTRRVARHSFDPDSRVLMADGSQRPIKDVNVGDQVLATDPDSGVSKAEPVTQLHRNTDHDLTTLTVQDQDGKKSALETTWHHPFWDATDRKWTDAQDLRAGHHLQVEGEGDVTVMVVANTTGTREMRDLTVSDIHTYYVFAGTAPVLVHNCGKDQGIYEFADQHNPGQTYVGKSMNLTNRLQDHLDSGRLSSLDDVKVTHVCGCEDDVFVAEHLRMEELRRQGVPLSNQKASPGKSILGRRSQPMLPGAEEWGK
ncbi:LamG-like jellyroll fold domain-containing protein [Paractinoplanes toevensis]|uniref:LamG-like jellyroll fold domain-containing protein n=1 Tax=Paractinoplanes toevensis TaxID=571911 RepID=UPI001BB42C0F|nr:LamG-like jellyroll fold domain-containing protein [Actinoplanes toevensis]